MVSFEISETFKNTYFEENLRTTASKSSSNSSPFLQLRIEREKCITTQY